MFQFKIAPTIATDKKQADSYDEFEERLHGEEFTIMRNLIVDSLSKNANAKTRVLDCGTGTGDIAMRIAKKYPDVSVVGIDASEAYLDVLRQKIQQKGYENRVSVKQVDLHGGVPTELGMFDFAVSQYVFHYRFDRIALFSSICNALKAGGKLIFGVVIPCDNIMENSKYWVLKEKNSFMWHMRNGFSEQESLKNGKRDMISLFSYCNKHGVADSLQTWLNDLEKAGFIKCKTLWRKSMDTVIEATKPAL